MYLIKPDKNFKPLFILFVITITTASCRYRQTAKSNTTKQEKIKEDTVLKSMTFSLKECVSFLDEKDKIDELLVCAKEFALENPIQSHLFRATSFMHEEKYDSANFYLGKIMTEKSISFDIRLIFMKTAFKLQASNLYVLGECDTSTTYLSKVWEDYKAFDLICSGISVYYSSILIKCNKSFKARSILEYSIANFKDDVDLKTYSDYFYLLAMTYPKSDSLSYRCQYLDSAVNYSYVRLADKEKYCN